MKPFKDRIEAGRLLGAKLAGYAGRTDLVVLGMPRGGVPVAFEVAAALSAPLDIIVVRKLGVPGNEELAMGAISSGGVCVRNEDVIRELGIPEREIAAVAAGELRELERRVRAYRGDRSLPSLRGRTVILVDDGIATGASMRAAVAAVRQQDAARVVVAVPVASPEACASLAGAVDDVVCLAAPERFMAVAAWYGDFSQTTDDEVRKLLDRASASKAA